MYRPVAIQEAFANLIGWRQNYDVADYTIAEGLTTSETGLFYQDFHPMLTLDNVKAIAPEFNAKTHPEWEPGILYDLDAVVMHDGKTYRAKQQSAGDIPNIQASAYWGLVDGFSEWLAQKTEANIAKTIRRFWTEKLEERTAKNILENRVLFDGAGRLNNTIDETGSWVGLELVPLRAQGITLQINKIGLQFVGTGVVELKLFHSSKKEIISSISCEITRDGSYHWFNQPDLFLPYIGDETDSGGSWYLVYNQDTLPTGMKAVNKDRDWSKTPCATCSRGGEQDWSTISRHLEIHPFKAPNANPTELWDIADNVYTYTKNYGFNLQTTLACDVTDLLITQAASFQNVLGLQMAESMMREFLYNPNYRIGRTQQNFSAMEIRVELEGNPQALNRSGIAYELSKAMDGLKLDMTSLSRSCFQTNNGGIRYRGI